MLRTHALLGALEVYTYDRFMTLFHVCPLLSVSGYFTRWRLTQL